MANLIQIKRSLTTATAPSLANGELAFTANGDHLFIGSNGASITIAGKFNPGVLTANQALVANGTGYLDAVKADALTVRTITANGASNPGAGYYLTVDGGGNTYWAAPGTLSINTAAQFSWTNTHSFAANVTVNGTLIANGILANGSLGTANQVLRTDGTKVYWDTDAGDISGVTAGSGLTGGGTSGAVTLDVGAGNGITVGADSISVTGANGISVTAGGVNVLANSGLVSNTSGVFINVSGDSTLIANATGLYVNDASLSIATSQLTGDIALGTGTSGNYVATITAGNGISGSASAESATPTLAVTGANGITVTSAGVNVLAGDGLIANATGVHAVAGNGISVSADAVAVNGGSTLTVNATGVHVNTNLALTSLSLTGDLTVAGNLVTTNVNSVVVSDPLIYLAGNNYTSDLVDIGFAGNYNNGVNRHTGLFRDASDGIYKLFYNLTQELDAATTVNTADPTFATATLQAYLNSGALVSNSTVVQVTANSSLAVSITANTLSLSTPLAVTSGGIGRASITAGAILVGNGTGATTVLAAGTDGYVLQSNGTSVVYSTLDGGTF